jgi:hypothetical protein
MCGEGFSDDAQLTLDTIKSILRAIFAVVLIVPFLAQFDDAILVLAALFRVPE